MPDDPDEPTQRTEKGAEIPVPKRGDVFRDLEKVARPKPENSPDSPQKP